MTGIVISVNELVCISEEEFSMRGIILKGIGIQYLWTQAAALGVFIIGVFTISLVKFSKKIT